MSTIQPLVATAEDAARSWARTWGIALVLVAMVFGGWELFWRARGFVPSVTDDELLWAVTRARASDGRTDTVVLVGSSRMQLAIEPDAFTQATGWRRPLQLAIPMGPSFPILRDLADDPRFRGTVVCEVDPGIAFNKTRSGMLELVARAHLWTFRALTPSQRIEQRLKTGVQERFVARLPALSPARVATALGNRRWPAENHRIVSGERFVRADVQHAVGHALLTRTLAQRGRLFQTRALPPARVRSLAADAGALASRIRARGGAVIFVRLPSSGHALADERRQVPRERYWDVFAAHVGAPAVHFEDDPQLTGFRAPDGVHLDSADTARFSRALGEILVTELGPRGRG